MIADGASFCVRTDAGGGKEGLYQFRHKSFQEALFVVDLVKGEALLSKLPGRRDFLTDNIRTIGGATLRRAMDLPLHSALEHKHSKELLEALIEAYPEAIRLRDQVSSSCASRASRCLPCSSP